MRRWPLAVASTLIAAAAYAATAPILFVPEEWFSVWPATSIPPGSAGADGPVTLGMKFKADTSGSILGVRFYKDARNLGTHVGNLWSSSGTLLAAATFADETASGWQQANFAAPVPITAGSTYVVSYSCSVGYYSFQAGGFAGNIYRGPLVAPSSSSAGGNGVYVYGAPGAFPAQTYSDANYWVDVAFAPGAPIPIPPRTITVRWTGSADATGYRLYASATMGGAGVLVYDGLPSPFPPSTDGSGVYAADVTVDAATVYMTGTAYNQFGESARSNEIERPL